MCVCDRISPHVCIMLAYLYANEYAIADANMQILQMFGTYIFHLCSSSSSSSSSKLY